VRKLLFAGAVAGGFLLLGGAPAHADVLPAPAGAQGSSLSDLLTPTGNGLDPAGGLNLESPLGGNLVDVKPGDNTPNLAPSDLLPGGGADTPIKPTDRMPQAGAAQRGLPAADVLSGALPHSGGGLPTGGLPTGSGLPTGAAGNLLGGGLRSGGGLLGGLPIGGLMPNSRMPADQSESALLGSGLPLLDSVAGMLPDPATNGQLLPATDPTDLSGMPAGGTPAATNPAATNPAATNPAASGPAPGAGTGTSATDDDKRLHEEPIDGEATRKKDTRAFTGDSRPVAGTDPGFN
jgi:hypothetical protein